MAAMAAGDWWASSSRGSTGGAVAAMDGNVTENPARATPIGLHRAGILARGNRVTRFHVAAHLRRALARALRQRRALERVLRRIPPVRQPPALGVRIVRTTRRRQDPRHPGEAGP